jgi:ABC-type multidrug transport system fused ATPase/permease subunit
MQQIDTTPGPTDLTEPVPSVSIWRRLGVYIFMVVWAVGGLAYTDVNPTRSVGFWQLTTVLFAIIAIIHVVRSDAPNRTVLTLKQLAHWGAFLAAMALLHSHYVTDLVTGDPLGVVTLVLLALAVFLDGVYVDWRFCVVGMVLAVGVVMVAWLDDWALGLFLVALVITALAVLYLLRHFSTKQEHVV